MSLNEPLFLYFWSTVISNSISDDFFSLFNNNIIYHLPPPPSINSNDFVETNIQDNTHFIRGSITVQLTSFFPCLESAALLKHVKLKRDLLVWPNPNQSRGVKLPLKDDTHKLCLAHAALWDAACGQFDQKKIAKCL